MELITFVLEKQSKSNVIGRIRAGVLESGTTKMLQKAGVENKIKCDFVAGCDGYHGISRQVIPQNLTKIYEKVYPFGWLGILSETPPVSDELIYANHGNGFALASMRNSNLSRYYIQTPITDKIENWTDKKFWEELKKRLPTHAADTLFYQLSVFVYSTYLSCYTS